MRSRRRGAGWSRVPLATGWRGCGGLGTHAGDGAGYARRRLRAPAKVSGQAKTAQKSIKERVAEIREPLNAAIAAWDGGTQQEGVQAFQKKILDAIKAHGLSERRWELPMHVGVEPHNRDESGLVPADVHDLLLIFAEQGWDYDKCQHALAVEMRAAGANAPPPPTTTMTTTAMTTTTTTGY